jgi:hypothetical protein
MTRDRGLCCSPGCHQTRHLEAHHRVSWADAGLTDLENLLLLCQWHHRCVHEGGMSIRRQPGPALQWTFLMPDGTPKLPWHTHQQLPALLVEAFGRQGRQHVHALEGVEGFGDPRAQVIRSSSAGAFDLHACVEAPFAVSTPRTDQAAA